MLWSRRLLTGVRRDTSLKSKIKVKTFCYDYHYLVVSNQAIVAVVGRSLR